MSEMRATRAATPAPAVSPASPRDSAGKLASRQLKAATPLAPRNASGEFSDSTSRLLSRLLNVATPRGVRSEAKLSQCIEDTCSDAGKLLQRIARITSDQGTGFDFLGVKESMTQLTRTMQPMTSRGADRKQLFDNSVKANLRDMSTNEILALHESIEKQDKVELYKTTREQTGEQPKDITDRRHFVAVALRDIEAQVKIELNRRTQFDPKLKKDADQAKKVNTAIAKLNKAETAMAAEIAESGKSKIHKGANASLLGPLRQDLPPAPPKQAKVAPSAPLKAEVAQPGADHNASLGVRSKKLGSAPLDEKDTNAAASRAAGKLLHRLAVPGKDAQIDFLAAKESIAAMSGSMRTAASPGTLSQRVFSASVMVNLQKMTLDEILKLNDNIARLGPFADKPRYVFMADAFADIQLQISDELKRRVSRGETLVHSEQVNAAIRS